MCRIASAMLDREEIADAIHGELEKLKTPAGSVIKVAEVSGGLEEALQAAIDRMDERLERLEADMGYKDEPKPKKR